MTDLKTGILLWSQAADLDRDDRRGPAGRPARLRPPLDLGSPVRDLRRPVPGLLRGLRRPRRLGAADRADATLGLLVGANTFRNPGIVAKSITTIDHISGGRAILGIGGAWMELEHQAHGIDFGSGFGQRLDWLDESVGAMRAAARRRDRDLRAGRPLRLRRAASTTRRRSRPTCRS